jgi:hypothetical protein
MNTPDRTQSHEGLPRKNPSGISPATVLDLLMNRSDVRHVYPKKHLKAQGLARGRFDHRGRRKTELG